MKTLFTLAIAAVGQFAWAQETIALKEFKTIAVSGQIELVLKKSTENKIVIDEGSSGDLDLSSEGGALAITVKDPSKGGVEATVYYSGTLENIAASGIVELYSKNVIITPTLPVSASGAVEIDLKVDADEVVVAAATGAEIRIVGTAKNHQAAVASGAEFDASNLISHNAVVTVGSGGEAMVFASDSMIATVSSGGELAVYGNPKQLQEVKATGAEINIMK